MEVRARERLVGALVLVAIVVLLVPAILKGPERAPAGSPGPEVRSVVIDLDAAGPPTQDEVLMPEPPVPQPVVPPVADSRPPPAVGESGAGGESPAATPPAPAATNRLPMAPPAGGAATETPAWAIQLGAFSTREKADSLVAGLRKRGYAAFVLEYRGSGKVLYRVRVGPEQERERAVAIAERLRKDGFQPVVAPHP